MNEKYTVEFPGEIIKLGKHEFILPTISLEACSEFDAFTKLQSVTKVFKQLVPDDKSKNVTDQQMLVRFLEADVPKEIFSNIGELIFLALRRNYPEIDYDLVKKSLDPIKSMMMFPHLINEGEKFEHASNEIVKNAQKQLMKTEK